MRTCDGIAAQTGREASRPPREERLVHARVSGHTGPDGRSRMTRPPVLPSASRTASALRAITLSRLNNLACRSPADALANACVRLRADVVRYSFIVMDVHHLHLAGLPAHSAMDKIGGRAAMWASPRGQSGRASNRREATIADISCGHPFMSAVGRGCVKTRGALRFLAG